LTIQGNFWKSLRRVYYPQTDFVFTGAKSGDKALGILIELMPKLDDLHALFYVLQCFDFDLQPEPIQELGPQLALFRISRSDKHKPGRMPEGDALALNDVFSGRRNVKQDIDQVVFEEVHLVDIEKTPVRLRQQTRLERLLPFLQSILNTDRAAEPILRRPEWQRHYRRGFPLKSQSSTGSVQLKALIAQGADIVRIAAYKTISHAILWG
jgi:hypothetical protein